MCIETKEVKQMKKLAIVVAVAGLLSACGTTRVANNHDSRAQAISAQQTRNIQNTLNQAPDWMTKTPKSDNAFYGTGTAVSSDFSMADLKAKTIAYSKICTAAGGTIRSQMKMFQTDTESASKETSELTIRSMCQDVDITGVETVDIKRIPDGNRIRTYVLVALPFGDANIMRKQKANEALARDVQRRAPEAFKELDRVTKPAPNVGQTGASIILTPASQASVLDVQNPEYQARRAEAMQKPGAVVGQVSVN
jgi:hypothetical protein